MRLAEQPGPFGLNALELAHEHRIQLGPRRIIIMIIIAIVIISMIIIISFIDVVIISSSSGSNNNYTVIATIIVMLLLLLLLLPNGHRIIEFCWLRLWQVARRARRGAGGGLDYFLISSSL